MKKTLIPTDFSTNSKNAMRYAIALFYGTPCHFYSLYVHVDGTDDIKKPIYAMGTNILVEKQLITIGQRLKGLEDDFKAISRKSDSHSLTAIQDEGYFLESIRKQVQKQQIDLIVLGTQGASELKEFFMGSHAGDVITKVECDVLVVPNKTVYKRFKQVILPIDFELA